jgi:hypothetical protein
MEGAACPCKMVKKMLFCVQERVKITEECKPSNVI